jgi:hypothetical protein
LSLEQYFDSIDNGSEEQTAPSDNPEEAANEAQATSEESTETAPTYASFDYLLPDDPSLPPTYAGKKTVGELFKERTELTKEQHKLRFDLNAKDAELRAVRATLELLAQRPQPAAPTAPTQDLFQEANVDFDRDIVTRPQEALAQTFNTYDRRIKTEIDQVNRKVEERLQQLQRQQLEVEGERAWRSAQKRLEPLGVTEEQWTQMSDFFMPAVVNDPRVKQNPRNLAQEEIYIEHFNKAREAFGVPAATAATVRPSSPPLSARTSTGNGGRKPQLNSHLQKRVAEMKEMFPNLNTAELEKVILAKMQEER